MYSRVGLDIICEGPHSLTSNSKPTATEIVQIEKVTRDHNNGSIRFNYPICVQ